MTLAIIETMATTADASKTAGDHARSQARELARRAMWLLAPAYARHRVRRASESDRLRRLELELEHIGERHGEQIDRLEDLARELVRSVASLRGDLARRGPPEES